MRSTINKFALVLGALLALSSSAVAATSGVRLSSLDWKWQQGDDPSWAAPGLDDSAWLSPVDGAFSPLAGADGVFWARARVPASALASVLDPGGGTYFLSGMSGCAFELYANGCYLGARGSMEPRYDVRRTISSSFPIPSAVIAQGGTEGDLVLALRCSWPGKSFRLPGWELADATAAAEDSGARNFWNGTFYEMLAALCLFLGCYFLFLYFFKTEAGENLYFALSLVMLALYFFEMGAAWLPFATLWLTALSKGCLIASVLLLYCFFSIFFRYRERPAYRAVAIGLAFAFLLAYFLAARDPGFSDLIFNIALLPILLCLVYGLVAGITSVRRGERESIPLLAGILVGSYFAVHDIYYQVVGRMPFAWLQGLTFFSLDVGIFVMLSMRQARLSNEVGRMAGKLDRGRLELEASLGRLVAAGDQVAAIGRELDEAVKVASSSAEATETGTSGVLGEAEALALRAKEAGELVTRFISSIDVVNARLAEEADDVARTAAAAAQLQAGAEGSASTIDRTAEFASSLARLTVEGEKAADGLGTAMGRVSETARGIQEVVDSVNDFADRTNLLAMNASIEAAHSGAAGKGFQVIATEVKKLAAAQGERAGHISTLAREIGLRIEEGSRDTARLREALSRIAAEAADASGRLAEAKRSALEQAGASAEVRGSMESLSRAVNAIRDEAARQMGYSEQVKVAVAAMVRGAEEANSSAAGIAREGSEIARAVRDLRELAERSLALTEELRKGAAGAAAREAR